MPYAPCPMLYSLTPELGAPTPDTRHLTPYLSFPNDMMNSVRQLFHIERLLNKTVTAAL